jgi:hypothetical protein
MITNKQQNILNYIKISTKCYIEQRHLFHFEITASIWVHSNHFKRPWKTQLLALILQCIWTFSRTSHRYLNTVTNTVLSRCVCYQQLHYFALPFVYKSCFYGCFTLFYHFCVRHLWSLRGWAMRVRDVSAAVSAAPLSLPRPNRSMSVRWKMLNDC